MILKLSLADQNSKAWIIIGGLLLLVSLPKGGMVEWWPLVMSSMLILLLICNARFITALSNSASLGPWLRVLIAYTIIIAAQLLLIPLLVDWNSPVTPVSGLDLSNHPVNTPAIIGSWVLFCCYWSFAWLVSTLSRKAIMKCGLLICIAVLVQAVVGNLWSIFGQKTILGLWPKEYYLGTATGTFVNHNHFANFLALGIPLSIGCFVASLSHIKSRFSKVVLMTLLGITTGLAISALIFSLSRMGVIIGALGLLAISYKLLVHRFQLHTILKIFLGIGLLLIVTIAANLIGVGDLLVRFERILVYDMRWNIWPAIFDLPVSMFVFGSGAGTFSDVFWSVHPPLLPKTAYYAHNDYLQFLLEYGLIGSIILGWVILQWCRTNMKRDNGRDAIVTSARIVILLMAIHCLVDFPMHIPANAMIFWFCIGVIANSNLGSASASAKPKKVRKRKRKRVQRSAQSSGFSLRFGDSR